ncbi:hypothetical protein TcWFU_002370 [Taenia crassiceps]|uniref:Uncharacterized protein n=1 Tax=Taenia crassiceps TaxID=6207 RepID=A0ABR4Q8G3_9CEST
MRVGQQRRKLLQSTLTVEAWKASTSSHFDLCLYLSFSTCANLMRKLRDTAQSCLRMRHQAGNWKPFSDSCMLLRERCASANSQLSEFIPLKVVIAVGLPENKRPRQHSTQCYFPQANCIPARMQS